MDSQIDTELKNRISLVFDNFEDVSADEGWLLLREKYPEKKRRAIAWPWWSAAAVLLLVLGIGTFNRYSIDKAEKISIHHTKNDRQNIAAIKKPLAVKPAIVNPEPSKDIDENKSQDYVSAKANPLTKKLILKQPAGIAPSVDNTTFQQLVVSGIPQKKIDSSSMTLANNAAVKTSATPTSIYKTIDSNSYTAHKPVTNIYKTTDNQPIKNVPAGDDKKVQFSIYAATYFNYARGSDAQINVGAGITSDISIGKKLKLSTGVALAQNTLTYPNGLSYRLAQGSFTNSSGLFISPKTYTAQLINLDIPLNLKYDFSTKHQSFVSAGLSSGTFINQTYSLGGQQQSQSNFSDFYFARVLNVSFGTSYPLGKTNRLVIEPFIKYPLGGLGAQQVSFGSGGINLKFNFKSSSK